jgi:hypothetical protein
MNVIFKNLKSLIITWLVIIVINQIFIFNICFAPHCIIAAIPHTFILAAIITYLDKKD